MADKSISELIAATQVTPSDNFVLEQAGVAKKLTGQILENWLVSFADGHGGIQSIVKQSTSGLKDTYRITLADTTTFDFVVTNGKGITGISKTSTSGLVDTYTIRYNDSTTSTFTVTNGAKGDKGDNAYTWFKYASEKPTSSGSSMGDEPDNWLGVYSGNKSEAPTDPMEYTWSLIKGEKGQTGDPATIVTNKTEYQVSDSGTIIPSGIWSTSIPVVTPGKFLWARTTTQFNTGSANYAYSISRFGIDGTGSVVTVNGVSPDEFGNVELTAGQLQCLGLSGGTMTGPIDMNGRAITGLNDPVGETDAVRKAYADKTYVAIANDAGGHNAVYRGKELGTSVTPEQWAAIKAGTFEDLFIGDYWVINGINWRIAAFDYYYKTGDTECKDHHVTIVPDSSVLLGHVMNTGGGTEGAYVGSEMYTIGLPKAEEVVNLAFGSEHIMSHRQYLKNAVTNGYESGGSWYDRKVDLMTEQNVYGCKVWGNVTSGENFPANYTVDKSQYPLFSFRPDLISNRLIYWLRDVSNKSNFAMVNQDGNADTFASSNAFSVRPSFSIYQI